MERLAALRAMSSATDEPPVAEESGAELPFVVQAEQEHDSIST